MSMDQKQLEEKLNLITELRQKFEEFEKGRLAKDAFDVYEKKVNARLDDLEIKVSRPPAIQIDQKAEKKPEMKAFGNWLRKGSLTPEERKVMIISDDTLGGYLKVPDDYVQGIVKAITEFSPIRSIATVRPTSATTIKVRKRTAQFSASRTAEIAERTERTGLKYGLEEMSLPEAYALVRISKQDLEDSVFNLEQEIMSEIVEQFQVLEGTEFVSGNGVGKSEGFLTNAEVVAAARSTAGSNVIAADDLVGLQYDLKDNYARNAVWVLKRSTVGTIRVLKEATTNAYIWQPGLQLGQPSTLLGNPVVECVDMPAGLVDNQYEVGYGDFKRGYIIGDRIQFEIQRLVEKYAEYSEIGFLARKRFNAQVVLSEAIKILKIKA